MLFNKKNLVVLCVTAGLGFTGVAAAATSAQVNVTGQIAAATCDLNVTNSNIDLGTHISSDITTIGKITPSSHDFELRLSNCSKAFDGSAAGAAPVQLFAKGTALLANSDLFNNTVGGTVGVELTADSKQVKPNTSVDLASITDITAGGSATVPMNVVLNSTVATPASQLIEAPITFSVSYE
ncbi:fimbrial protein [Providencia heimbachae]|uniref:fimbrial protein n=1 Tax=Providencia heimbachae TaxID=333962 RepID=UPI0010BF03E7|nr:type 1 fimbrial protein [Providencia heimbachae]QCJ69375.1 fimbrial protein [Providencia heimbachae]